MVICIDVQPAVSQRTGVGRYTSRLVEHLGPLMAGTADRLRLFYFDFRGQAVLPDCAGAERRVVKWCPGRAAQWAWKTLGFPPANLFAGRADLYHFTNFIIPPLSRGRAVVTIHDVSFLRFPEFAEQRNLDYLRKRIHDTAGRAAAILTLSRHAAGEIEALLPGTRGRVFPVPLAVDSGFARPPEAETAATLARLGVRRPYLLTVGTIEPRKNHALLLDAFERLKTFDGDLVIAGMPGWKCEPIFERMRASPAAARIRYLRFVADADLPALYAGAELLVFPSHYEGFGLPPLEAMACGTAVLSSCGGALAETLDGGARLLRDYDPDHWAAEIDALASDAAARAALVASGRSHAARFSWAATARGTLDVYRKAVAS